MTIAERVKEIRLISGLTQAEFAEKIGLKQTGISGMEKGARAVTDRTIQFICEKFNVNEEWLRNETGEIFIDNDFFSLNEYAEQNNLTDLECDILKKYMSMDPEVRKLVIPSFQAMLSTFQEISKKDSNNSKMQYLSNDPNETS